MNETQSPVPGWEPPAPSSPEEPAQLDKEAAYVAAAAENFPEQVALSNGSDPEAILNFLANPDRWKSAFPHASPELKREIETALFLRGLEKRVADKPPEQVVGLAALGMADLFKTTPEQRVADIGIATADIVARATEKDGVLPEQALGFVLKMFELKAMSQGPALPAQPMPQMGK